tara:strand:- start:431 stop:772 length:342 start_codon:yes stop_codon:yes gene_type:complete
MSNQFDFKSFNTSCDTVTSNSSDKDYFFNIEVSTVNALTGETQKLRKRHDELNSSVASAVSSAEMVCYLSVSCTILPKNMQALADEIQGKGWTMQPLDKSKSGKTFGYIINPE